MTDLNNDSPIIESRIIEEQTGPDLSNDETKMLQAFVTYANLVVERQKAFGQYGKMYGGDRNIPEAAGYKTHRDFSDYNAKYSLQGVATRIVDAPGDSTWQEAPEILDGKEGSTPFTEAWKILVNFGRDDFETISDQKSIWHYLRRVDQLSGVGRYGCLILGIKDGSESLTDPLVKSGVTSMGDFLYLSPYDEGNIVVSQIEEDPTKSRYNLPIEYTFTASEEIIDLGATRSSSTVPNDIGEAIHWTRVLHVSERLKNNEIFGSPRLEGVYDYLDDLLKVTAATGESAWQLMTRGLIASTRDGYNLPKDTTSLRDAMEKFIHEQMRVLELQGMDVTLTSGQIVDPTGVVKAIISLISATTGIPQRLLLGSEAGHLASTQDEKNWSQRIMSRQINFAEAIILRPLINRLIYAGLLPKPSSGSYQVKWPSQLLLTDLEKAQKISQEMGALAAGIGPDKLPLITFLKVVLKWPEDVITAMLQDKTLEKSLALIDFPAPPL